MFDSRSATRSDRGRSRLAVCLAVSVLVHGGALLRMAFGDTEEAVRRYPTPIAVRLLRMPPSIASAEPADAPEPSKAAQAPPPKPPVRPARQPDRVPPTPPPVPRPAPTARSGPEASRDQNPLAEETSSAPTPPEARVYGRQEVDRAAAPTRAIRPRYPRLERRRGREGSVLLRLRISAGGEVERVDVAESAGEAFDTAALEALRDERFTPALVDGAPVASLLLYRLRFALR